jgi:hypothetical protein
VRTIASTEGEYLIDNRGTPGVSEDLVIAQGLPAKAAHGLYEEACYTCSHCHRIVLKNRERTRPRGFCKKCNHVICDPCDQQYLNSGHQCIPFAAFAEEIVNAAAKGVADPVAAAEFHFNSRITR